MILLSLVTPCLYAHEILCKHFKVCPVYYLSTFFKFLFVTQRPDQTRRSSGSSLNIIISSGLALKKNSLLRTGDRNHNLCCAEACGEVCYVWGIFCIRRGVCSVRASGELNE